MKIGVGFIWLWIRSSGGLLWLKEWAIGLEKCGNATGLSELLSAPEEGILHFYDDTLISFLLGTAVKNYETN